MVPEFHYYFRHHEKETEKTSFALGQAGRPGTQRTRGLHRHRTENPLYLWVQHGGMGLAEKELAAIATLPGEMQ